MSVWDERGRPVETMSLINFATPLGTEHRLTKPCSPQTNGMFEHFNGRGAGVLTTCRFDSAKELEANILRYAWLYNCQLPQKAVGHVTPVDSIKKWYAEKPELFILRSRNRPELDKGKKHD